ncbi:MAG: threonyl-tRNA synthetase [candidate division Zixibacteria bacterium SM1_73]|nr:MAG: threonyl-tRNA synthetase [candidate division Zixibacteria bacterium SM1_73]
MSEKIKVILPGKSKKEYERGISVSDILKDVDSRLIDDAVAARINGEIADLSKILDGDSEIEILTFDSEDGRKVFWHSTSHVMAQAVQDLFPEVKLAIGPSIEQGFYYDFDKNEPFTPDDLEKIENKMEQIIKADHPFKRIELSKENAIELFSKRKEKYKLELISEIPEEQVILYQHDNFVDLCRGPHLPSTGRIKAFKLVNVAGAYWRGKERNPMLQRIYGISYPDSKQLEDQLKRIEEIKKRDHRRLGRELDLFGIYRESGPGLVVWHPKGALLRRIIEEFWIKKHYQNDYELIYSPHIARLKLWEISGHTDFYQDNMYAPMKIEEEDYQIKPMNCPYHILVYKSKIRSYRDLPLKWAELGTVYRYERSGVLHGLMRVRGFTQDDAHIFCRPDQLEEEVLRLLDFTFYMLKSFGFDQYDIFLSTRPEKAIGEIGDWEKATAALRESMEKRGLDFEVDEGGGAFYGPKIDIKIKDLLGRPWQCTTIQFDFNLAHRFDLSFVAQDGKEHRPFLIHRALLGSLERFFGVLIEHYAGAFPLWLSPVQIRIMPITDEQNPYSAEIKNRLQKEGFRAEVDDRNEKINYKISEAEREKIPYMFIVGKREVQSKSVSVRRHKQGDLGQFDLDEIIAKLEQEVENKNIQ